MKVKPKLALEGGLATVGPQYWHVGEIGFESQPGYYNNPVRGFSWFCSVLRRQYRDGSCVIRFE